MAAVRLTTDQKVYSKQTKLSRWCKGQLKEHKVSQTQLARYLDVTPQNIWKQFENNSVTVPMLIAICTLCDIPAEELERALKV